MARRNLCYKHNCQEFDKLPDILRPVAAEWHTVPEEKCEVCQEKKIADLRAALEALVADERKFVTCHREAADSYFAVCNFCGVQHNDEYQIEHEPDCPIQQARAALGLVGEAGK